MNIDAIEEAIREHWGERCKTRVADDFPDLDGGRCATCVVWEQFDALVAAQERLADLEKRLVDERIDSLWNAYNIGHEQNGRWRDLCMSDPEWLVRECDLDPDAKDYDAETVKAAIPVAALRVLTDGDEGGR